jgi:hypothetical protein
MFRKSIGLLDVDDRCFLGQASLSVPEKSKKGRTKENLARQVKFELTILRATQPMDREGAYAYPNSASWLSWTHCWRLRGVVPVR